MKPVEWIMKHVSQPLVFQSMSAVFAVLLIWDWASGIGLFSRLNHEAEGRINISKNHDPRSHQAALQSTLNLPLFGDYLPGNLDAAGVRQSMLNLKVVGVLFSENEKDSQVLLQKPEGQEQFYRVDDRLPDGSTIKRITTEGVLILRAGELERLSLPKEELKFRKSDAPLPLGDDD